MEILQLIEYEDDLAEGTQHHGRSALLGMVARKTARNDGCQPPARA